MTSPPRGTSPAVKTTITLLAVAAFLGASVGTILWCLPKKQNVTIPWNAGGGDQPRVVRGADARREAPAPVATPESRPDPARGLALAVTAADGATDTRVARLLALAVEPGEAPALGLAPGAFTAVFSGSVEVELRDRYRFAFLGTGHLELAIEGKVVLAGEAGATGRLEAGSVRLNKGRNRLIARYRSPEQGPARLRVEWATSEFAWEPLPPTALVPALDPAVQAGLARRAGVAEARRLQCTACHGGEAGSAPDLQGVAARLRPAWTRTWLLAPDRGVPMTRAMPHLFAPGAEGEREAADVTAWLFADAPAEAPAAGEGVATAGAARFAQLGCIGCHLRPDAITAAGDDRVPLAHVGRKYRPGALAAFLRDVRAHDPGSPMPDFALSTEEASDLAAFLLARAPAAPLDDAVAGDAVRGRELARARGCANCHAGLGTEPLRAPAWATLSAPDCGGPARYERSPQARADLAGVVGAAWHQPAFERAEQLLHALRCTACHMLDGEVDAVTRRAGEVADLLPPPAPDAHIVDQSRPALTWAGEKLRTEFLRLQLTDVAAARSRPWLHARMPAFAAWADVLAAGLPASHGLAATEPDPPPTDPATTAIGGDLVSAAKGFACVTCHGIGSEGPTQVFEVQGVDFSRSAIRLRRDYFLRWMRDPKRVDPSTKMARYSSAEGKTGFTHLFGGDAEQQFAAIHAWILTLRKPR